MQFTDFRAGQIFEAGPHRVSEAELLDFARHWDAQWFHTDAQAAAAGPFGGLIASGWHTCAIAMRMVVQAVLHDTRQAIASPGVRQVCWSQPVRPGDELRLVAKVLATRRIKPRHGMLDWQWKLFNQHGVQVLELETTTLFRLE